MLDYRVTRWFSIPLAIFLCKRVNALNSALDREYGFWSLFRFALPTIIMMIFMSLYTIVDGIFVCRFVGSSALSAVNIVYPLVSVVIGLGVMLATGGSAVVARKLGEGDEETACRDLTLLVLAGAALGTLFSLLGLAFSAPMSRLLGASDALLNYCTDYLRILLLFAPASILQLLFQSFFVTAGRPGLGLGLTVCSGLTNAVLDYAFIVPLDMGITGAALATAAGYCVTALAGMGFFALRGKGLRFRRPRWESRMLLYACGNGSSEMVTNLSNAVITFLFNQLMLSLLGEDGVAAITIVLYAQFLLTALYMGFSMGVAPVISFNYGAANHARLQRVFRCCLGFIALSSALVFGASLGLAELVVAVFSPAGTAVHAIALDGFYKFAPAFLFAGLNLFASALFTALSDGLVSAVISFARTFGFLLLALLLLPGVLGVDGVWIAVPFAELACWALSIGFLAAKRNKYHYV